MANTIKITVLFEDPFWVGILERSAQKGYTVTKVIFGAEPTNNDIYHFLLKHFDNLQFSQPVAEEQKTIKKINPKRKQRAAQKELQDDRLVSKTHESIKRMQEEVKVSKKQTSKQKNEELKQRKYQLKQEKRKQKHNGH